MTDKYIYSVSNSPQVSSVLSCHETLFHCANGYIGVRGAYEEGYPDGFTTVRGSYINGVYDNTSMPQAEALFGLVNEKETIVNVADVQDIKIYVDGELCSPFANGIEKNIRTLDMRNGVVTRTLILKNSLSKKITVEFKRAACFTRLPLFVLSCTVRCSDECNVVIKTSVKGDVFNYSDPDDPRMADKSEKHISVDKNECKQTADGVYSSVCSTVCKSNISVAVNVFDKIDNGNAVFETESSSYSFTLNSDNDCFSLTRYVVFTDSRLFSNPSADGYDILKTAVNDGLDVILREQREYLDAFWGSAQFEIEGDDGLSQALTFNLYQLLQSVGKDGYSHLAAKGLSGEGYEGHYFWDTEMYVQPVFTLISPRISLQLLNYRYSKMEAARENARILGHKKGVLFPWRTISGKECSGYFPAGTAQYHINGAVAYAVIMYYLVTKDIHFMADKGLEMLIEISRLWADVGCYSREGFVINCVTGPDEYTCLVNNNYYTNCCAKYDFYWTVKIFSELNRKGLLEELKCKTGVTSREINKFKRISEMVFLPYDPERDLTPQDDSFFNKKQWDFKSVPKNCYPLLLHYHPLNLYRHQVCKQADVVLAYFLYEDYAALSTVKNSFDYYEKITTHDSSLSKCIFSIVSSKLGFADKAYSYFRDSVEIDLKNSHGNTKDGIHTANMGGSCLALIFGFAGLRIKEEGLSFAPVIPKRWKYYSFILNFTDKKLKVRVDHEYVTFRLADGGKRMKIKLYGRTVSVEEEKDVRKRLHI